MTGTPAGVGPVEPGNVITAGITGVDEVTFHVVERQSKL
jgi:2-keto-4-pentenoate hydratase/2-oxohepta-3-ene-1,7-dioic acid hydratase in catechol pathway